MEVQFARLRGPCRSEWCVLAARGRLKAEGRGRLQEVLRCRADGANASLGLWKAGQRTYAYAGELSAIYRLRPKA